MPVPIADARQKIRLAWVKQSTLSSNVKEIANSQKQWLSVPQDQALHFQHAWEKTQSMLEGVRRESHHDSLEALHRALLAVRESSSPRRTVDALIFAFGFNSHMGETCTSLASRYGVTKAAFNLR